MANMNETKGGGRKMRDEGLSMEERMQRSDLNAFPENDTDPNFVYAWKRYKAYGNDYAIDEENLSRMIHLGWEVATTEDLPVTSKRLGILAPLQNRRAGHEQFILNVDLIAMKMRRDLYQEMLNVMGRRNLESIESIAEWSEDAKFDKLERLSRQYPGLGNVGKNEVSVTQALVKSNAKQFQ